MKNILAIILLVSVMNCILANTADELREKANQAVEQDEYDLAIEYHNQAIQLEPENANAYYLRGIFNLENIDDELALNDFNKAVELGFEKTEIYYYRGLANDCKEAVDDLTIYLNSDTEKNDLMLVTAYNTRGSCRFDLEDLTGAMEDYSKVIEIDPMKYGPYNMQAHIFLINKQYVKAMNVCENMLELFPDAYKVIRYKMINVKNKSGDFNGALKDCNQLMQEGYTKFSIYLLRADAYIGIKEYQLALDDVNTAIKKNSISIQMYNLKAKAYLGLGNYDEAEKAIDIAIKLYPEFDEYLETKEEIDKAILNKKKK
jgi:tetratricopeptide (TPR) repeat protein